eukprot:TRINITY_DN8660_c0_g1_i1.p2 TRINITY_DN8660_c0_g1~~TRINITY_DN8660_c0_g1_i1.p2  ORF type:complete len:191 (+),score=41.04 TRINITY_DN8660_c0_g1_i1:84-656(+)
MAQVRWAGARAAARQRHSLDARQDTKESFKVKAAHARHIALKMRQEELWQNPQACLDELGYNSQYPPQLSVSVTGHEEEHSCTMYQLSCSLTGCGATGPNDKDAASMEWHCQKRLCDLREFLHDPLKDAMEADYSVTFGDTPFARHGGLPGTTDRLRAWFLSLTTCMNTAGTLSPDLRATVLRFLETPID